MDDDTKIKTPQSVETNGVESTIHEGAGLQIDPALLEKFEEAMAEEMPMADEMPMVLTMGVAPDFSPVPGTPDEAPVPGSMQAGAAGTNGAQSGASPCNDMRLAYMLRRLRAEVQDLRSVIERVEGGKVTLANQAEYLKLAARDLKAAMKALNECAAIDDSVAHIVNLLQQMSFSPLLLEQTADLPALEQTNAVAILNEQIRKIELLIGQITIPERLNQWLEKSTPGNYVPFHLVFRDEIPNDEDRLSVLNYIAWSPEIINNGIVDVTSGVVFRSASKPSERRNSIFILAACFLVMVAIAIGIAYLPLPGVPVIEDEAAARAAQNARATAYAIAWFAVLFGVLVHLAVAGIKREKESGLPTVFAVAGISEVINARMGQYIWKLGLVMVGFFILIFAIDATASPINAFLVGYSLDSIVGVFGATVDTRVEALQTKLTGK